MRKRGSRLSPVLAGLLLLAGCAGGADSPADGDASEWQGTITTEGNVTTVVNESGSVWGGTARLVEEASIGVAAGADEYMLGSISSIYATDDLIYVIDSQVPAVRAYDDQGNFVRTFGRSGQGPGEYERPSLVTADDGGRIFVFDSSLGRINVYSADGEVLDPWPFPDSRCCAWAMYPLGGDAVWAPVQEWIEDGPRERRYGVQAVGPSGPSGEVTWVPELEYERSTYEVGSGSEFETPFSPWLIWAPAPGGRLLVGASDRYRFEVHGPDSEKLVVERYWEPVPAPPEHREWERQRTIVFDRKFNDPGMTLDLSQIPDHKPAYSSLVPTLSGDIWVRRYGASERLDDCPGDPLDVGHPAAWEQPCWTDQTIVDAFGADGRYLGEVDIPDAVRVRPLWLVVDGSLVVAMTQDEAGTVMVKRYRLVTVGGS